MHTLAIVCVALAAVNACVGAFYLLLHVRWPQVREHLPFGCLCVSLGLYDACCAGLYQATTLAQGVPWQRGQLIMSPVIAATELWFVTTMFLDGAAPSTRTRWTIRGFLLMFTGLTGLEVALDGPGATVSVTTPAIKPIVIAGRTVITYYESQVGWIPIVAMVGSFVAFLFLVWLMVRYFRRDRARTYVPMLIGQVAYLVASVNDALVASQVYSFVYVSEYAFMLIVVLMADALLERFVGLHRSVASLNRALERRVEGALADIKVLQGLLPICASCKRIRDEDGGWMAVEGYVAAHSEARFSHGLCPECIERLYPELADGTTGGSISSQ